MKAWIIAAAVFVDGPPMPALAQAQLTAADIQRLQDTVFDAAATCRGCAIAMRGWPNRSSASSTSCATR